MLSISLAANTVTLSCKQGGIYRRLETATITFSVGTLLSGLTCVCQVRIALRSWLECGGFQSWFTNFGKRLSNVIVVQMLENCIAEKRVSAVASQHCPRVAYRALWNQKRQPGGAAVDKQRLLELGVVDDLAQGLGGVAELLQLVGVEAQLDNVAYAAAVEDGGGADVEVVEPVLALQEGGDGQDHVLVAQDRTRDAGERVADAEGGVALAFDDVVGGVAGADEHLVHLGVDVRVGLRLGLQHGAQRHAADGAGGEHGQFGVAVLADDVGVHGGRGDVEVQAEVVAPAGGVQHGAGADDLVGRQAGLLPGDVGQHIHGVGGHDVDAVEAVGHDLGVDGLENLGVTGDQVDAGLAVALRHARAVDHHGGVAAVLVGAHRDIHVVAGERNGVVEVLNLGPDEVLVEVDDGQVVCQALVDNCVCEGGADSAGADKDDLVAMSHGHATKCVRNRAIACGGVGWKTASEATRRRVEKEPVASWYDRITI